MTEKLRPAQLVQLTIIKLGKDLLDRTGVESDVDAVSIGLIQQYTAAMFMTRPEFMYKVFSEIESLCDTEDWLDRELDVLEQMYESCV